jgi:hypothetical protein
MQGIDAIIPTGYLRLAKLVRSSFPPNSNLGGKINLMFCRIVKEQYLNGNSYLLSYIGHLSSQIRIWGER